MRREGRVRGKPSSKSRLTGRCRQGKTRCRSCRDHPVDKSRAKRMGRFKRFAVDVRGNPSLADFHLQPSLKHRHGHDQRVRDFDAIDSPADETAVRMFLATVNGAIESAFAGRLHDDDDRKMDMACTGFEFASVDGTDVIPAIEEAFHRHLGIFENAVEGTSFAETQFARKWGSVLSEESWSEVELSESDSQVDDDDWTMVEDDGV